MQGNAPAYVSVFAGRIADTGRDPVPLMREAVAMVNDANAQLIWASPRELLNVFQADEIGCHVITATTDILKKLPLVGKDLARVLAGNRADVSPGCGEVRLLFADREAGSSSRSPAAREWFVRDGS